MMTELLGWLSSFVLVLTIGRQVHRQWRSGHSEGVSIWLFVGQMIASAGFTIYSALVDNWVFVVTNALMLVFAIAGVLIVTSHRRKAARQGAGSEAEPPPSPRRRHLPTEPHRGRWQPG
jgi:MtN3 and saliva related transmembrane protein